MTVEEHAKVQVSVRSSRPSASTSPVGAPMGAQAVSLTATLASAMSPWFETLYV
jgi:hypothetical protein